LSLQLPDNADKTISEDNWRVSICHSLSEIEASAWDKLGNSNYPFTRHAFLYGLENLGCLEPFGWQSAHCLVHDGDELIAALPCYI